MPSLIDTETRIDTPLESGVISAEAWRPSATGSDAPEHIVHTGGLLGSRQIHQRPDGTWVNALNEQSFESMPSVAQVFAEQCIPLMFLSEKLTELDAGKNDEFVPEPSTGFSRDGLSLAHNNRPLTSHAMGQLARIAEVPVGYFRSLLLRGNEPNEKLARTNVNMGLRHRLETIRGAATGRFFLRYREEMCRAVLTDTYTVYDNLTVLRTLLSAVPNDLAAELCASHFWCDQNDMTFNVLIPDRWHHSAEELWGMGLQVANSEIGNRCILVQPFLYDAISGSGLVWGKQNIHDGILMIRHVGAITPDLVQGRMRENITVALNSSGALLQLLGQSKTVSIVPATGEDLRAALFYIVGTRYDVPRDLARKWYRLFLRRPDTLQLRVFDLVHAMMQVANHLSGESQLQAQTFAGSILAASLSETYTGMVQRWMSHLGAAQRKLVSGSQNDIGEYLNMDAATGVINP